jgi:hypothetical protein
LKNLIILVVSIFCLAATECQKPETPAKPPPVVFDPTAPQFPVEIKHFYVMDFAAHPIADDEVYTSMIVNAQDLPSFDFYKDDIAYNCLKFEIISGHPFKIKYIGGARWIDCRNVGGYLPADHQKFYNFLSDLTEWAKHREPKEEKK